VAVLPRAQKTEINISPADIEIEFFNATGPGGQNVNKRKTAVRIIHLPSGEVVTSRTERSQLQNKENALSILAGRLLEKRRIQQESQLSGDRRSQIGQAKRAEKIRTYNFPQDRLTDHRIKKSWHNLEEILKGNLSPVIDELQKTLPTT
jgi:peptide chain release factor 1